MSRLCVKNLPKYVTEERLREFFSQKGQVTDAKLMRTKDGKSRQFAFIGFRSDLDADQALRYFHNSYLDTARITCELARKVGDPAIPRPWSRHSAHPPPPTATPTRPSAVVSVDNDDDDPRLKEFLQVMQPRASTKIWTNDLAALDDLKETTPAPVPDDAVSDMDYFRSKVRKDWSDTDADDDVDEKDTKVEGDGSEVDDDLNEAVKRELPMESGRLFVRNLPYTTNEEDLSEVFSQHGDVSQVHIVLDKNTKRSKGIAYVLYALPEAAARAFEELDNSIFQGRLIHVMPAKAQNPSAEKLESSLFASQEKKNLKQRREEQKKASEASGNTRAWNSLFMRSDTVDEYIARKHGISKNDLLQMDADEHPAVRKALGETHVIAETKKALSNAGVNIAALEECASGKTENVKRSNHVILVKNLPYGTSDGDIATMFGKFGNLDKIILPPTKVLALVIFLEASEARAAFKGLAYKRYKDVPLYLEWAPGNVLTPEAASGKDEIKDVVSEKKIKSTLLEQTVQGIQEEDIDPDRVESRTLFVKNLNFKTSDESLRKYFSDNVTKGSIKSVKVQKHLKNGKNVSMGFGFVEFDSVETATDASRDLQGTVLDGHALILQLCHARNDGKVLKDGKDKRSSTKLMVRNIAFEATEKDIRQLFSPFGQIKSVRLPMNPEKHKGYAFVEFVTKQEAQKAIQALANTHLYGRHLVIELAKEGESLDELRLKTATQFEQSSVQKLSKRRKLVASVE